MERNKLTLLILSLMSSSLAYAGSSDVIFDAPAKSEKSQTVKVASYNIMASRMSDTDDIAAAVKNLDAEIIGLQEVDNKTQRSIENFGKNNTTTIDQAKYIADKVGMNFVFCQAIDFDGGQYGTAILSKYDLKLAKRIELPNVNNEEARSACGAYVSSPNFDEPIMAVVTHITNVNDELKFDQVNKITKSFSVAEIRDAYPIIIGDMNSAPNSKPIKRYDELFNQVNVEGIYTAPSWNPDRVLDYIFTSKAQKWNVTDLRIPASTEMASKKLNFGQVSDHLPVVATLHLLEK